MKRVLVSLLAAVFILGLAACSPQEGEQMQTPADTTMVDTSAVDTFGTSPMNR